MALVGIPISDSECIGDSLDTINNSFSSLDLRVDVLENKSVITSVSGIGSINVTNGTTTPVISLSTVPISSGGTGQITASAAFIALIPSQTNNSNKLLTTNGSSPSWTDSISLNSIESKSFLESKATPTITGETLTLDLTSASFFYVNLNSSITTFNLINVPPSPKVYTFTLQFVANGNSYAVAWPGSFRWSGASLPTLTTTSGKVDTFTFLTHDGGANYFAFVSDQNL
jgi:hypothetical protein